MYRIGGWDIATPLLNGWMGVDLFFVLSGFLITHHLLQRWPDEFNRRFLMRYWGKRVLRTFPAYYAAVLIALAGVVPYFTPASTDPVATLRVHLLFLQDYLGSDLVPAFWSLGVEEKFYLLSPLILWWIRQRSPRLQFSLLAAAAFIPLALRVQLVLSYDAGFSSYPGRRLQT